MQRNLSFLGELSDEDKLLVHRLTEYIDMCSEKRVNRFTMFLNEHQRALCSKVLNAYSFEDHLFYGGYEGAGRTMCGLFAPGCEAERNEFPIGTVSFSFRGSDKLTHRDFLGCIMSLGITRGSVGDIVVSSGKAVVFATELAAGLIKDISKVGRVGVKSAQGFDESDIPEQKFSEIKASVASTRFDCIVSAATRLPREKASALIKRGLAELNYMTSPADKKLEEGDVFTVRGHGKYYLESIGEPSKKDRLHIIIRKYL